MACSSGGGGGGEFFTGEHFKRLSQKVL